MRGLTILRAEMGPAMVTATLANCNFASPAMFELIAGVRSEPAEAAKREKERTGANRSPLMSQR